MCQGGSVLFGFVFLVLFVRVRVCVCVAVCMHMCVSVGVSVSCGWVRTVRNLHTRPHLQPLLSLMDLVFGKA